VQISKQKHKKYEKIKQPDTSKTNNPTATDIKDSEGEESPKNSKA
jgi:hypothetical protein